MKVGDVVLAADAKTLKWKPGIIVAEIMKPKTASPAGPFGMRLWKILVDGKIRQYTDAAIREINESR